MPSKTVWVKEKINKEVMKLKKKRSYSAVVNELLDLGLESLHDKHGKKDM